MSVRAVMLVVSVLLGQEDPAGVWFKAPAWVQGSGGELSAEELERITSLGYTDGYVRPSGKMDVTINKPDAVAPGTNLIVSAHAPEAFLMSADGKILHSWRKDILELWPELKDREVAPVGNFWRCHLFPNGDLLALYNGFGLVKLDKNSRVLWKSNASAKEPWTSGAHHDWWISDDRIIVLSFDRNVIRQDLRNQNQPIFEDFISILDLDGRLLDRFSILDAFLHSSYAPILEEVRGKPGHILHCNSVQTIGAGFENLGPAFKAGNLLVSCRDIDTLAIVDPESKRVVWALKGQWMAQHSARLLPSGKILLFDNQGLEPKFHSDGFGGDTQLLEFDPATQQVVWSYKGNAEHPFHCYKMGNCHRLPNGNTLVADSISGRGFEVTQTGEIVWEWISPYRAGSKGELIAALGDVLRIPADFPLDWAQAPSKSPAP